MTFQPDPLLIIAVLGLVNFVKSFSLTGKVVTLVSMLIGVIVYVAARLLSSEVTSIVIGGIIMGLAASGFYDLGSMLGARHE